MQDAYLKVWERWERVSGMDDPTGFFFRTALKDQPDDRVPRWMREQRLTVDQALRLLTSSGAYGIYAEDDLGMLAPGMLADFVVLSEDPHDVPKLELERIDVEMVFVGGILEVCAPSAEALCPD